MNSQIRKAVVVTETARNNMDRQGSISLSLNSENELVININPTGLVAERDFIVDAQQFVAAMQALIPSIKPPSQE